MIVYCIILLLFVCVYLITNVELFQNIIPYHYYWDIDKCRDPTCVTQVYNQCIHYCTQYDEKCKNECRKRKQDSLNNIRRNLIIFGKKIDGVMYLH